MNKKQQIEDIKKMVTFFGSQVKAVAALEKETGYSMPQSTLSRITFGEAKPAMIALVHYALKNAKANRGN